MNIIYRITERYTASLQPDGSHTWEVSTRYCGPDRYEARTTYHANTHRETSAGFGNPKREIIWEVIEDSGGIRGGDKNEETRSDDQER